ncbi:MAG: lytic transglycosylase domain-containing protein [Treponema sp.]|nr:lytic transglycosylase domain-containing protein [Treponema sp.]
MKNSRSFLAIIIFLSLLPLHASEKNNNQSPDDDFVSFFEKVVIEELPPADDYYIDDSPLNQILKLFDEEDYERQKRFLEQKKKKVIMEAGEIAIPNEKYAQDKIQDFIARYMTNFGKQNLYRILDKGESYRLYIRKELKKRGMPAALEYLPLVESEYTPTAKSRSGARGLWQFMENSMSPFLKKNEWIDERLDPWKSTQAALSKLQDNYRVFKDWTLAIGAYNCGAGAMRRALKKAKKQNFWYLAENKLIPDETINYLPKLLAIAEITEHSGEYNLLLPDCQDFPFSGDFDYVSVKAQISLEAIAGELRLDYEKLSSLNSELLHAKTPPAQEYRIRFPAGLGPSAAGAIKEILTNK